MWADSSVEPWLEGRAHTSRARGNNERLIPPTKWEARRAVNQTVSKNNSERRPPEGWPRRNETPSKKMSKAMFSWEGKSAEIKNPASLVRVRTCPDLRVREGIPIARWQPPTINTGARTRLNMAAPEGDDPHGGRAGRGHVCASISTQRTVKTNLGARAGGTFGKRAAN